MFVIMYEKIKLSSLVLPRSSDCLSNITPCVHGLSLVYCSVFLIIVFTIQNSMLDIKLALLVNA